MGYKKIKVLYVIDTLYSAGAERSLLEITKRFKNINPVFVHIYKTDTLKKEFITNGLKVYSLEVPGEWNLKLAKKRLKKIYLQENPDIIHSTLFRSDILTRRLKADFPSIALISSFVNNSYHPKRFNQENLIGKLKLKFIQYWDTFTSGKVDHFISNSETIKNAKCKDTNVDRDKVTVIFRGRDIEGFNSNISNNKLQELREDLGLEGKKVLLNVSRLIERKGQKDIILAMKEVSKKHPDTILLIAGGGPFESELDYLIKENGLRSHVKLLGRRNDIASLFQVSDIFVFPSYFEGLPGALIEAMISDVVIVCSNIPENLECVSSDSAIIFEVANVNDIERKLNKALLSNDLNDLKANAEMNARNNFDIKYISNVYENFYKAVMYKN